MDDIRELVDLILQNAEMVSDGNDRAEIQLMSIRGLLMLIHSELFDTFDYTDISVDILHVFLKVFDEAVPESYREEHDFMK